MLLRFDWKSPQMYNPAMANALPVRVLKNATLEDKNFLSRSCPAGIASLSFSVAFWVNTKFLRLP
jgi:hypothetical protein